MKPTARATAFWGASFALLAAALAVGMVMILREIAPELPATPPHTTFEYQIAFRPFLAPLLKIYALDQMFVVAYGAAFVAAAVRWARPPGLLGALAGVAVIAGLATAGIDTLENLRAIAVLAALPDGPPAAADLDTLDFLGAIKWIAAGVTMLALAALVPRRGPVLTLLALLFALDGVASLALGAARLKLAEALAAVEPTLANGVVLAMPVGLLLLGLALLAEPRAAP